ncbi:MAG: ABC transporter ATP-binding protein [Kiritimatiellaeota bacterium]|nr:ABC transporter ATP-binding protein [Kiritimatiellota bacterium]
MSDPETRKEAGPPPLLAVAGLDKSYPNGAERLTILREATFAVGTSESLAVVGPSGSGKSTLLNLLGLLDVPDRGSIRVEGREITLLSGDAAAAYRRDKTGFVFQDHHLLPQCTALENVLLPLLSDRSKTTAQDRDRARGLLDRVGIPEKENSFPDRLSGGERQRVAIARALIRDPLLLLCDEPTGNLDQTAGRRVVDLFLELVRERRMALVMVTHNLELAALLDRSLGLDDGRLRPVQTGGATTE